MRTKDFWRLPLRPSALAVAVAVLLLSAPPVGAQVPAGVDCWLTEPGSTAALPEFPAGFFGTKNMTPSDAIPAQTIDVEGNLADPPTCDCQNNTSVQWVDQHGNPVEPDDIHAVQQVPVPSDPFDTCVERLQDAMFPGGVGTPETIDIEIVALSLRSVNPITVTYGMEPPSQFDVFITLDESTPQSTGQLQMTPTQLDPPAGTVVLPNLPVNYQFEFQEVGGSRFQLLQGLSLSFTNPREVDPEIPGPPGLFERLLRQEVPLIPTLSGWGLALFVLLVLMAAATFLLRQRRRTAEIDS